MPTSDRGAAGRPATVEARGWGWRHAGRRAWAVRDLDLTIGPGERVLLLGPSGAGKSTLLHALAGVLGGDDEGQSSGLLTIDGRPPGDAHGRAGLVLQDPESQAVMARVGDDVAFGCENLGVPRDELWERVPAALDAVGLDVPLSHPTAELSGGQKQRLALAGALAMRPGLLLLDEPTANLDPEGVVEVRDAVARSLAATGATAVIVEHRVDVWRDVVTRVVVLGADGEPVADGDPHTVLEREGERLAAQGVWVPGREPAPRLPGSGSAGAGEGREPLLSAAALAIARAPDRIVRTGIDVDLAAGEVWGVTGPNGSGKTTLALTLGGLLPPAGGEVRARPALADGAGAVPIRWRSRELLPRIGSIFQAPEHQFLAATVRDELAVGPRALRLPDAAVAAIVDPLLDRLGLAALAGAHPFTLSGGQKRRLSVGTALATRPRVLILDEPTFGQDALTWSALVELLDAERRDGRGMIAVSHDHRFLDALAAARLHLGAAT